LKAYGEVNRKERLALYGFNRGRGGIPRVMINLINGFVDEGFQVDLLVPGPDSPDFMELRPEVRVMRIGKTTLLRNVLFLVQYLRKARPPALLSNQERSTRTAVMARCLAGTRTPIFIRVGTTLSVYLKRRHLIQRILHKRSIAFHYRRIDGIIAVSRGVAEDIAGTTGIPLEQIHVIRNPTVPSDVAQRAQEDIDHPWFAPGNPPVVLAVGRLTKAKDFSTLMRAFAKLRSLKKCRLVILGEGKERQKLTALAGELGIENDTDLPGYAANPFAYMDRAALFVLSSAWEGSPNVLIEALSVGVPVVATDCENGPREILENGRYGTRVPVGDVEAMAEAMFQALEKPMDKALLQSAVEAYKADRSAVAYLTAMGLHGNGDAHVS
jgi:glycosyltransferase involved in cell wall biosynthesis